jgi:hypothetical protein
MSRGYSGDQLLIGFVIEGRATLALAVFVFLFLCRVTGLRVGLELDLARPAANLSMAISTPVAATMARKQAVKVCTIGSFTTFPINGNIRCPFFFLFCRRVNILYLLLLLIPERGPKMSLNRGYCYRSSYEMLLLDVETNRHLGEHVK